jgi:hypothetical protein
MISGQISIYRTKKYHFTIKTMGHVELLPFEISYLPHPSLSLYILGSYDTVVVKLKMWQQKFIEMAHEYPES